MVSLCIVRRLAALAVLMRRVVVCHRADCMVTFSFLGDPNEHICEVQLIHNELMTGCLAYSAQVHKGNDELMRQYGVELRSSRVMLQCDASVVHTVLTPPSERPWSCLKPVRTKYRKSIYAKGDLH